jgi:hypothetical protein
LTSFPVESETGGQITPKRLEAALDTEGILPTFHNKKRR